MNSAQMRAFLQGFTDRIQAHAQELTDLDAAIGDADHGTNMQRGLSAVMAALPAEGDPAALLKSAAMTMISRVGGASGPLYGTAFLRAATAKAGREEWTITDLRAALEAAYGGLLERGKAQPGDKTMLDAWRPALDALAAGTPADAAQAARAGADATRLLVARKGRASYLGERSVGHLDPGAVSSALMFEALAQALQEARA
ncbi:dihydroxyacetone kinase subunit DhaL [Deinococcus antarcticus]|uniref:Dihydroxyacetone kinase subunit DhaL n=1 Tax=Deinococcus antarcticus TaxID=1298767 RepID=A0ABV8A9R3_9DEIO